MLQVITEEPSAKVGGFFLSANLIFIRTVCDQDILIGRCITMPIKNDLETALLTRQVNHCLSAVAPGHRFLIGKEKYKTILCITNKVLY